MLLVVFATFLCGLMLGIVEVFMKLLGVPDESEVLDSESRHQKQSDVGGTCSICLIDYELGGPKVSELNCANRHVFHTECVKQWLEKNSKCPLCREEVDHDGCF